MAEEMELTEYQRHLLRWRDCKKCSLWRGRSRMVFTRGHVVADVLFVGEAPGESENVLGVPFIGPAGKLLDTLIAQSERESIYGPGHRETHPLAKCFTNLVCCIPYDEQSNKAGEPPVEAIRACRPRLQEFVEICRPKLIVMVGSLSQKWAPMAIGYGTEATEIGPQPQWASIVHPAAILRAPVAKEGQMIQDCLVTLANAFDEIPVS